MVRMDHGLQTGGRASLACGGLQVQSAPWPREACVSTYTQFCEPVQMGGWGPYHPHVQVGALLGSHSCASFLQAHGVPSKGRARSFHKSGSPDCMSRGCSCPEEPAFLNLEARILN